jgi:serine protease Do
LDKGSPRAAFAFPAVLNYAMMRMYLDNCRRRASLTPWAVALALGFAAALWPVPGDAQTPEAAAPAQPAPESRLPHSREQIRLSFAPLVKRVAPAVVNINTRKIEVARRRGPLFDDPFFRRFFGKQFGLDGPVRRRVRTSLGSGVIVHPAGLVVTNVHVIKGADQIRVVLNDRREFEAEVELLDERTDLAVLRIKNRTERFPHLTLDDSERLEVGDLVLAIGNPFGVGQTVTSGIVSALARTTVGVTDYRFFIQTDAAINPGNSGGALVTMDGGLVGINTAIYSRTGGSIGIGFAVPSAMVKAVLAGLATGGRVVRPWFGATGQAVDAGIAESLGFARPGGVLINKVHPAGPAAAAGLKIGDVVIAVEGRTVEDPEALRFRFATLPVGGKAALMVIRDGRKRTLSIVLASPPEDPPANRTRLEGRHPLSGATVANLSPALADELALSDHSTGVVVLKVSRRSIARRAGIRPKDIIRAVNGQNPLAVAGLQRLLGAEAGAGRWQVVLERGGKTLSVIIGG